MKVLIGLVVILSVIVVEGYQPELTGEVWQNQTAPQKMATLWSKITANTKTNGWYSLSMGELFTEDLSLSFTSESDDMPSQGLFNSERKKLIHSVGSVAKAKWKSNGMHNFTGLFASGCDNVLIRLSLAAKPDDNQKHPNTVPGMALKMLRDTIPSDNIFAMYSLLGQSSFNFFQHDFSSHPPKVNQTLEPLPQKLLDDAFSKVTKWPTILGMSSAAQYDQKGRIVRNPNFPFRLVFHPVTTVHNMFPSAPQSGNNFFLDQLAQLKPGPLFEIYAQISPFSEQVVPIGELSLTTSPTSSKYGDKSLFFEHVFFDRDLTFRPEWLKPTDALLAQQESVTTPPSGYVYPDLPWN